MQLRLCKCVCLSFCVCYLISSLLLHCSKPLCCLSVLCVWVLLSLLLFTFRFVLSAGRHTPAKRWEENFEQFNNANLHFLNQTTSMYILLNYESKRKRSVGLACHYYTRLCTSHCNRSGVYRAPWRYSCLKLDSAASNWTAARFLNDLSLKPFSYLRWAAGRLFLTHKHKLWQSCLPWFHILQSQSSPCHKLFSTSFSTSTLLNTLPQH